MNFFPIKFQLICKYLWNGHAASSLNIILLTELIESLEGNFMHWKFFSLYPSAHIQFMVHLTSKIPLFRTISLLAVLNTIFSPQECPSKKQSISEICSTIVHLPCVQVDICCLFSFSFWKPYQYTINPISLENFIPQIY